MKKTTLLTVFFLLSLIIIPNAIALQIDTPAEIISCSGKLTYTDKVLTAADNKDGVLIAFVQATVGFPEPNLHKIDTDCNSLFSTTYAFPTSSPIGSAVNLNNGDYYYIGTEAGNDFIYRFDSNINFLDKEQTITNGATDIGVFDDFVYILKNNGTVEYYSDNLIWLGNIQKSPQINITSGFNGISPITEQSVLLRAANNFWELSADLQTVISSTTASVNAADTVLKFSDDKIAIDTDTDTIVTYNISDLLVGDFIQNLSATYCVTDTILCTNTVHNLQPDGSVDSYCQSGAEVTCPVEATTGGCSNNLVNNVSVGSCNAVSCESTCQFEGRQTCTGVNTYYVCGDYDADVCLETGSNFFCPAGQQCVTDATGIGSCIAGNVTGNLLPFLTVEEAVSSTNAIDINIVSGTYYIESVLNSANIDFQLTTSTPALYSSAITDYTENTVINDNFAVSTADYTGTFALDTDAVGTHLNVLQGNTISRQINNTFGNKVIRYTSGVEDLTKNAEYYVQILDGNSNIVDELNYEWNTVTNDLTISRSLNGVVTQTIITDTGISENLYSIVTEVQYIESINSVNYFIIVYRSINGEEIPFRYWSIPFATTEVSASTPESFSFTSTDDTNKHYGVEIIEQPDFNNYQSISANEILGQRVEYIETGCYNARLYANQFAIPTYHFYKDVEICVVSVGELLDEDLAEDLESLDAIEKIFGEEFTQTEKTLIAVIMIALSFGIFFYGYMETKETVFLGSGVVMAGVTLFLFAYLGYIPAWLLIMVVIIAAAVVAATMKNTFVR